MGKPISDAHMAEQLDVLSGRLTALGSGPANTQNIASELEAIRADLVKLATRNATLGAELREALALRSQKS